MSEAPLLEVKNLKTHFHTERGKVTAVNGVSFSMQKGEIIGIGRTSPCSSRHSSITLSPATASS